MQGTAGEKESHTRAGLYSLSSSLALQPGVFRSIPSIKMSSKRLLAIASLLASLGRALPSLGTNKDIQARAELNILAPTRVGVYMCVDANWEGYCEHLLNGPGLCSEYIETVIEEAC